jgi:mannose-6-phosphate isomerase-like protein (cupin superfamily)
MQYTRRISVTDAVDTGYPGYQAVFVASPESVTVLAGFLGNGGHPPLHIHDVDLFYVVLGNPGTPASRDNDRLVVVTEGELTAEIAAQQTAAPAPAVIVIPAGLPHRIWNSSPAPVRYLDADLPTPDVHAKLAAG